MGACGRLPQVAAACLGVELEPSLAEGGHGLLAGTESMSLHNGFIAAVRADRITVGVAEAAVAVKDSITWTRRGITCLWGLNVISLGACVDFFRHYYYAYPIFESLSLLDEHCHQAENDAEGCLHGFTEGVVLWLVVSSLLLECF